MLASIRSTSHSRPRHGEEAGVFDAVSQAIRKDGHDLRDGVGGRARQPRVGQLRHPTRAEDQRLDFFVVEHERRQHEAGAHHEADTGFAGNWRALRHQRLDVAIDRAHRHRQLRRQLLRRDRPPVPSQRLNQGEQPLAA